MKKHRFLFPIIALTFALAGIAGKTKAQNISSHFFGQNAWMPDTTGNAAACIEPPCILYGKLHQNWSNIQNSGSTFIRFGGISPDRNMPTNFQYIRMIDSIRAKGMEPIIQVPFYDFRYTATEAAAIVQYINVTKGKNIKYWIIGNEPDLKYSYTTAAEVAAYIRPFASAMKNVDPSILIIGPECAWYDQPIINGLTNPGGPDDITGKDAAGRYYVDVISFHTYPFNGSQTRSQVISKLTSAGGLQDNLVLLNARITAANTFHNRTGAAALKTAITEANINWQNSSTDNLSGVGANSFVGGQFVAEMLAVGMKNKVDFINIWSVIEGNTTALNIGYIDKNTGNKKPLFYHYKLLADNFKGNYIHGSTTITNVKTFASQNSSQIAVMIMNQELSGSYNYTVRLNSGAVSGSNPLKITVNAGVSQEYSDVIDNQSTVLLLFDASGALTKKCEYTLADHAMLNIGPTCTDYAAAPLPISLLHFNAKLINDGLVSLEWATASQLNNDYFTVQRTTDGIHFEDISNVDGEGNSNQPLHYQAYDNQPLMGTSYYRLKQTDFDGKSALFGLEEIITKPDESEFLIYPNPSDGSDLTLKLRTKNADTRLSLIIVDMQGRTVCSKNTVFEEAGEHIFKIDLQEKLSSGIYFVKAESGKEQFKSKLIVN